ncbi:hypothetical protein BLNAU_11851 [Blattamonas nauphoetae]|uniref:Uncharacterized protein n=1 Tax=Blattamonas nauphoetae TaxID=2049346 RepID=A0ABQ9XNZ2_9EUKA|nr:hypothetical protein BLNAU_11851 [Blattamonas nauphoetae]
MRIVKNFEHIIHPSLENKFTSFQRQVQPAPALGGNLVRPSQTLPQHLEKQCPVLPPPIGAPPKYLPANPIRTSPPPATQETVTSSQIESTAIELFDRRSWSVSENVFTKAKSSHESLLSFEFEAVVARMSLTIRNQPEDHNFVVGIVSSSLSTDALTNDFSQLKGGAGWNMHSKYRASVQNRKTSFSGYACEKGREGQRAVLEADGREGKRTLKLSQDGETQPIYFSNIPVPFRFAVYIYDEEGAVEIESVEVVSEPQMVGGTIPIEMDE